MSESIHGPNPESAPRNDLDERAIEEYDVVIRATHGREVEESTQDTIEPEGRANAESEHHFAEEFMGHLRKQPDYTAKGDDYARATLVPSMAHTFVLGAVKNMDQRYKGPWQAVLNHDKVENTIKRFLIKHGASVPDRIHLEERALVKRTEILRQYHDMALRHYLRYPEVLAAHRLREHLLVLGEVGLADSTRVLLAAYGTVIASQPSSQNNLPVSYWMRGNY